MSLDSNNVRVAVTGAVYVGALDAVAPTSAESAIDETFADLGYVSEDGVSESRERSTNEIRAWQKASLVREVTTESSMSYSFTLLETKKETVELYYGSVVAADGSVSIDPGSTGGRQSFVIDVIDGDSVIRMYIPQGEVTEVGEQAYTNGEAMGFEVTVKAYADENGVSVKKFYGDLNTTGV